MCSGASRVSTAILRERAPLDGAFSGVPAAGLMALLQASRNTLPMCVRSVPKLFPFGPRNKRDFTPESANYEISPSGTCGLDLCPQGLKPGLEESLGSPAEAVSCPKLLMRQFLTLAAVKHVETGNRPAGIEKTENT